MEAHRRYLGNRCRICSSSFGRRYKKKKQARKASFRAEFLEYWGVDVEAETDDILPTQVCDACRRFLYRVRHKQVNSTNTELFYWTQHSYEDYFCQNSIFKANPSNYSDSNNSSTDSIEIGFHFRGSVIFFAERNFMITGIDHL